MKEIIKGKCSLILEQQNCPTLKDCHGLWFWRIRLGKSFVQRSKSVFKTKEGALQDFMNTAMQSITAYRSIRKNLLGLDE